ncbi:MAG: thioredoxin family protein [Phycisphaerales bacterium]|nr:thioredoxin family protein [Phycisphaerales bacterium]
MSLKMRNVIGLIAGALMLTGSAMGQRFSTPEKPPEQPEKKPDAEAPKQPGDVKQVEGGGGRFTLPLTLYDEKADAAKVIKQAREEAMKDNRRVLIMWGENKCEFCAYLNELLNTDPVLKQLIETEYVWIKVDIGKFDKNIDLAYRYKTPITDPGDPANGKPAFGAPALTIVDARADEAIAAQGGNAMVNKPMMPPDRVFNRDFILNHLSAGRATPQVANMLVAEAQARAKGSGKKVLIYFHLWASDSCKVWDKFVKDPEAESILNKAFVLRKIDVDRHIAGQSALKRIKASDTASPPWATVLDAEGKPTAEAGKGLEFDSADTAAAIKWLGDVAGSVLTRADREALTKLLDKAAAPPSKEEAKK